MIAALLALAGVLSLVPGQRVEYELASGEARAHAIKLEAGQFVQLAVVQQGLDLTVSLVAPDGALTEIDTSLGPYDPAAARYGREPASILAASAGTYRLEARAKDASVAGRYAIEAQAARAATDPDRARIRAEAALVEASALIRQARADSCRVAAVRLDAVVAGYRALADRAWELEALIQRGTARWIGLFGLATSLEDGQAALALARALADRRAEGRALAVVQVAQRELSDYDAAVATGEQELALWRGLGDRRGELRALRALGWSHGYGGDFAKHAQLAREARELTRGLGDLRQEAITLTALGRALGSAGEYQEALNAFLEARDLYSRLGDREGEVVAGQDVANARWTLGDDAGGLAAAEEAVAFFKASKNPHAEVSAYTTLGTAHAARKDWRKAFEAFQAGVAVARAIGDRKRELLVLAQMGAARVDSGGFEEALRVLGEAWRLNDETRWFVEAALLYQLARANLATGRADEARRQLLRSVEVARAQGSTQEQVQALNLLGRVAHEAGDPAAARVHLEAALEVLETMQRNVTSPRLRMTFVASQRETRELYVDVLMSLHRQHPAQGLDARALEASEATRARGLLDQLSAEGVRIREGVDPALVEQERMARNRLGIALDRQLRLSQSARTDEQVRAAARAVQTRTVEWDAVRGRIRASSPRFAELRDPEPPSLDRIRNEVLDDDTQLLEYALGDKRSFLWVASRDALATYELPGRATVDAAAREASAQLAGPSPVGGRGDALVRLGRMVLGPAAKTLTAKRLLIVPDGGLHYVPFAALPDPERPGERLLARREVVAAPSASVVALLRRETAGRAPASKAVAVLADPVFDPRDARVASPHPRAPSAALSGGALPHALRSAGVDGGLGRLPFTRREAGAILALVPARDRMEALDFDASRATATGPELADYRYVHLATHGFLNSAQPDLSGIVLSLVDRGGGDTPGFLTLADVFNLRLNAELVVLSGCRTALGQELRGEGLVGISRGFMYAGAPRVVASLWKVDDAATAELMKRFYRGILKRRLAPSAALRGAQLDLLRRPRFRHPFYWAAFQLQGEWR